MTDIDKLIARRNKLLCRRDGLYDHAVIDRIDAKLRAACPPGLRNDVDQALGRPCAVLSEHHIIIAAATAAIEKHAPTPEEYERMSAGKPDGIIEHYSSSTEGHW